MDEYKYKIEIVKKLKKYREDSNMSQADLANALGLSSRNIVAKWEEVSGKHGIPEIYKAEMYKMFGWDLFYVAFDNQENLMDSEQICRYEIA